MAEELIAAVGYVWEAVAGASTYGTEAASIAAEAGGTAAEVAAANAAADTAAASALSSGTSAATYASYAAQAAAALGGVAQYQSSTNQAEAAKFNAGMAATNAQMASMQAGAAEDVQRRKAGLVLGEQRAAFAGSGVDPSSGSGLLVQEQSAANAELDALNIRYQGVLQGRGLLAESDLETRQSRIFSQNAGLSALNAPLSIFGAYRQGQGNYLKQRNIVGAGYYGGGY